MNPIQLRSQLLAQSTNPQPKSSTINCVCVCLSDVGGDGVLWWKHADERRPHTRRHDRSHIRGASEADGPVAEGQRRGNLQHDGVASAERQRHPQPLVGVRLRLNSKGHVYIYYCIIYLFI